jgi:hypothetical protein
VSFGLRQNHIDSCDFAAGHNPPVAECDKCRYKNPASTDQACGTCVRDVSEKSDSSIGNQQRDRLGKQEEALYPRDMGLWRPAQEERRSVGSEKPGPNATEEETSSGNPRSLRKCHTARCDRSDCQTGYDCPARAARASTPGDGEADQRGPDNVRTDSKPSHLGSPTILTAK